jgi:hypothetical protein
VIRHKPEHCARYAKMRQMYLSGMNSREIGRELNVPAWKVLHALKVARVNPRRPGGINNPNGINRREQPAPEALAPEAPPEVPDSKTEGDGLPYPVRDGRRTTP